ncbi:Uma2 family endonuclease [Streptomyces xiamenensis]|uniref:Uma2 family endonuclease n=1 Tax=Streptomyces xiamenensis TaxID=408015 RepID=UPI003682B312
MSAAATDFQDFRPDDWDAVVRAWEELEVPPGYKAEIIEGIIALSPAPSRNHANIASRIHRQLLQVIPDGWDVYPGSVDLRVPLQAGMYQPDLAVLPRALVQDDAPELQAGDASLIVEVTSPSNARADRVKKLAGYAMSGVPLYLLVDNVHPVGRVINLFGDPQHDVYRTLWTGKFGDPIPLPAPFNCSLDTTGFPGS